MQLSVVIPYPGGLPSGGGSGQGGSGQMETGPDRIPKGLRCNKDNKHGSPDSSYGQRIIGGVATDNTYHPWFTQLKVLFIPLFHFCRLFPKNQYFD